MYVGQVLGHELLHVGCEDAEPEPPAPGGVWGLDRDLDDLLGQAPLGGIAVEDACARAPAPTGLNRGAVTEQELTAHRPSTTVRLEGGIGDRTELHPGRVQ